ncbi:MAG: NAD(P)H-hydrate dehydratase [Candidatus Fimenecus sp.]
MIERILSVEEIKEIECIADQNGISYMRLMENAGSAMAKEIRRRFDNTFKRNVVIFCGGGRNAGDGYVVARRLAENGYKVSVILTKGVPYGDISLDMYERLDNLEIEILSYDKDDGRIKSVLYDANIVVDAIFGTGFHGCADEKFSEIFNFINSLSAFKISLDVPSGISADTGKICGAVIEADLTLTVIALKKCFVETPASSFAGEVKLLDIGVPSEILQKYNGVYTLDKQEIFKFIPKKSKDSNKGDFGKGLIIAGSYKMPGAAVIASSAAVNSGAGLICTAFPDKAYAAVAGAAFEKILLPLRSDAEGFLSAKNDKILLSESKKYNACLIGCGMGVNIGTELVVRALLSNENSIPVILDADALNIVAKNPEFLQNSRKKVIITPHPGEAARLLGISTEEVQRDRIDTARRLYEKYGAVVVLKGNKTVITNDGVNFYVNLTGNNGMATAGMGDALAGLMLSMLMIMKNPLKAAISAVYLHGLAGDTYVEKNSKLSLTPTKLIKQFEKILDKKRI